MEFVLTLVGFGVLVLWVSAFIRLIGLVISAKDREAFSDRPVLHVFWFGSAVISFVMLSTLRVRGPTMEWRVVVAKADLRNLELVCKAYGNEYTTPLMGTPAQVLQVLRGNNTRHIVFIETPSRRNAMSKQGELLDPWGTPYRFCLTTNAPPVFISAGPNHLFGDQDDLSTTN